MSLFSWLFCVSNPAKPSKSFRFTERCPLIRLHVCTQLHLQYSGKAQQWKLHLMFLSYLAMLAASVVQRQRAGLWNPSPRVQAQPKPLDFSGRLSHVAYLRHVKEPESVRMEVAAFGPNCRPFLAQVVPPFTTRVSGGETWQCKQERLKTRVCTISLRLQCIRGHQPPDPITYIHIYLAMLIEILRDILRCTFRVISSYIGTQKEYRKTLLFL